MSLIEQIKTEQVAARKIRATMKASLLTTVIGEAEMVGKNAGNRAPTDEEVIQVLKKFEKNLLENIRVYGERNMTAEADGAWNELTVLRSFMPEKLTDEVVKKDIVATLKGLLLSAEQKHMGAVVKVLKEKYGTQFDGAQVSRVFKTLL